MLSCRISAKVALASLAAVSLTAVPAVPLSASTSPQAIVSAPTARQSARGVLVLKIVKDAGARASAVVVRGPRGYRERVTTTTRLHVRAGWYRIRPRAEDRAGGRTVTRVSDARVHVRRDRTATVHVVFDWKSAGSNDDSTVEPTQWQREVLRLTNQARGRSQNCGSEGRMPAVAALRLDDRLTLAARRHADEMADRGYFDHDSPDGRDPGDRISAVGYRWSWWGENIAAGQRSPAEVVADWLDSDGHCANLMNKHFIELGVGVAKGGKYGTYWVQDFARPQ